MVHNHWPVGPEPQLCLTSLCYSWCQSNGGGCPTRYGEWGYAYRYVWLNELNKAVDERLEVGREAEVL